MVRFAAGQIRGGHDPLTAWFPYLGLGSPQFLHYQSTPAMLTGLAGLVIGPDAAFRWSLYLLWCLWPVAIYGSARVFGLTRQAAAMAAAVAPLLHSAPDRRLPALTAAGPGQVPDRWLRRHPRRRACARFRCRTVGEARDGVSRADQWPGR